MSTLSGLRLHHFAISAAHLEVTAAWYRERLGFVELFRYAVPEMELRAVFLRLERFRLEIFEVPGSHAPAAEELDLTRYLGVRGLKHIALAVDDLDSARDRLAAKGVAFINDITEVPDSGGERFCFFADPDGVLIELYEPRAEHEPQA